MHKINLLYIITKLELGGAQKQLSSLLTHLDRKRYNPSLFTCRQGLLLSEITTIPDLTLKKSNFLERTINPLFDFLTLIEIYFFIKKNNIKIVHTHSSKAGILGRWAAKLAGVPYIIHTVHGWSFNDFQPYLKKKFFVWLERLTAGFTDKIIVVSNHDKQKGLENHIGKEDKYHLIHYGIDYKEFSARDGNIREELGIDNKNLVVGMISCFKPQKSPQDFIKLAYLVNRIVPETKFLLVGDGVLRKKIEKLISRFNLQKAVILTGWRRDIPRILSTLDVFALTSLWEGLPISVLEAMAASLPVIATSTGGISDIIVEGETGFLVSPRDIKTMSERLTALLKDQALRRQIGQNARGCLDSNFSFDGMVKNSENLYMDLISRKGVTYVQ